jgi:hypothetical protein
MDIEELTSMIDALVPHYQEMPGSYEDWLLHLRRVLVEGTEYERQGALRWIRAGLRSFGPSRAVQVRTDLRRRPEVATLLDRLEQLAAVDLYACPCCGYLTNPEPQQSFNVCPVCRWEDDGTTDPAETSGANKISLDEGRTNFTLFGACIPTKAEWVRPPQEDEAPRTP